MLPVFFSLRCIQLHVHMQAHTHADCFAIACAKVFQQFFVIIVFQVMHFPNSQNQASIKCKHVACASLGLVMDLYKCQQSC